MTSISSLGSSVMADAVSGLQEAAEGLQEAVQLPEGGSELAMIVSVSSAEDAAVEMKAQTYAFKAGLSMVRTSDEMFQTLLDNVAGG